MKSLGNNKLWSHLSLNSDERHRNKEIRERRAVKIYTYRSLVPTVARIANHNPGHSLFFRGQDKDYKLESGASSCYPTIFRTGKTVMSITQLRERYAILDQCSEELVRRLTKKKIEGIARLRKFEEIRWSILQHYGVCGTPLLDVTHSLRVAASLALNNAKQRAYVLIYALPHAQGTITYSTDEEILNVRLLGACPSDALRPHFQEGFLVGTFPSRVKRKHPSLDFGGRLVAKFEIPKKNFWDKDFQEIPADALYPAGDNMMSICSAIRADFTK